MSKQALGKGLSALIPTDAPSTASAGPRLHMIPLSDISPNPMQPRQQFNDERLQQLADSLKRDGMMQPVVLKKNGSGYHIVAGERRFRAAKLAGLEQVPATIVEDADDARMLEMALIENIQREDLNPIELAEAYQKLIASCGLTQQQLAERVGKSRAAIANQLRLLKLPARIVTMVRGGEISEGHARTLLALSSEDQMLQMAQQMADGGLTVREAERSVNARKRRKLFPRRKLPALAEAESHLKQLFGTSVKIIPGLKRGRIEIEYYSDDDLDRILDLMRRIQP